MKRETACKVWVKDILNGDYKVTEGWNPNYVVVRGRKVSRVNVMGTVVGKDDSRYQFDDGSASIWLRSFDAMPDLVVGEFYLVVGRPREFMGERFVVPEIIKKIDRDWLLVRQKELALPEEIVVEQVDVAENSAPKVLELVRKLDEGSGVSIEKIVAELGPCESIITKLLEEGEIFELRPGVVKLL
jgi:RPA family protein